MLRETFLQLLRKRTHLSVAGESPDNQVAIKDLSTLSCDVLLLSSLQSLKTITQQLSVPERRGVPKVVMFGMDEDQDIFLQSIRMGARGYLLKDVSSTEIIAAVHTVARGEAVCPPKLSSFLFEFVSKEATRHASPIHHISPAHELTCRQRQLMALVARGMTNKEIAFTLRISEFTVKNHIHRIMSHLNAESRHAAVDLIRMAGLFLNTEDNRTGFFSGAASGPYQDVPA